MGGLATRCHATASAAHTKRARQLYSYCSPRQCCPRAGSSEAPGVNIAPLLPAAQLSLSLAPPLWPLSPVAGADSAPSSNSPGSAPHNTSQRAHLATQGREAPWTHRPAWTLHPLQILTSGAGSAPHAASHTKKSSNTHQEPLRRQNRPRPTEAEGSEFRLLQETLAAVSSRPPPCSPRWCSTALAGYLGLAGPSHTQPFIAKPIARRALRRYSRSRRGSSGAVQCEHPRFAMHGSHCRVMAEPKEAGLDRGTLGRPGAGRCGLTSAALEPHTIAARQGIPPGSPSRR